MRLMAETRLSRDDVASNARQLNAANADVIKAPLANL